MPKHMAFSGAIWMLDLYHRAQPVDKMDIAMMRWALEQMVERQSVHKVLGTVVVRAESVPGEGGFKDLSSVTQTLMQLSWLCIGTSRGRQMLGTRGCLSFVI